MFHVEQCGEAAEKCSTWNIEPHKNPEPPPRCADKGSGMLRV